MGPLLVLGMLAGLCMLHTMVAKARLQNESATAKSTDAESMHALRAKYFFVALVFLELIIPSTSTTIFSMFECSTFDSGKFLTKQLTISCEDIVYEWWRAYALFFVFVYPIGCAAAVRNHPRTLA